MHFSAYCIFFLYSLCFLTNSVSAGWASIYQRALLKQAVYERVGQQCGFHKELRLGSQDELQSAVGHNKYLKNDPSLVPRQEIVEAISARLCQLGKFKERDLYEALEVAEGRMTGVATLAYEASFKDAPSSEDVADSENLSSPSQEYDDVKGLILTVPVSKVLAFVFGTLFGSFCTYLLVGNKFTPHNANTKLRRPEL